MATSPYNTSGTPFGLAMNNVPIPTIGQFISAAQPAPVVAAPSVSSQTRNDYNTQKTNLYSSITDAASNAGTKLGSGILDYMDSVRQGQRNLDTSAVNNELSRFQGQQNAYDTVGRGIRSGGVLLNNKNAGTSSAAEGIARAYGDIGRRELTSVNNQYELANRDLSQQQLTFDEQRAAGIRKLTESKNDIVNSIVTDARTQLAALNAAAEKAQLPDRVDIEREKEAIKAKVLAQLQQYDQQISQAQSTAPRSSVDANRIEATRLLNAGTVPQSAFDLTSQVPTAYQNTGPFAGPLPIFTYNGRRQES